MNRFKLVRNISNMIYITCIAVGAYGLYRSGKRELACRLADLAEDADIILDVQFPGGSSKKLRVKKED